MSDLKYAERQKLEDLFQMGGGYVLSFTDFTFGEFVTESTGRDIYDDAGTYAFNGQSKAKRLRAFWKVEPNHVVGKLIGDMLEQCEGADPALLEDCRSIAERLQAGAPVTELSAITPQTTERDLELLTNQVRAAIDANQPEGALDRLHTFVVNYVRRRCVQRGIAFDRKKPLHSLFGEYRKNLKADGHVESAMSDRILKSAISTLDAFNDVRNNRSLAHDNRVLGYDEALLICNHVCSMIRYLNAVEAKAAKKTADNEFDGIPF
ncbi:MAG: abortive infection family protein [Planctomycetes bacterium]|nr:abortive infection family protein [Planctomycetota bacterium]